jgi:hypothetical protein
MMVVKSAIFKLKTININIYILILFYNLNLKNMFNQRIKATFYSISISIIILTKYI